MTDHPGAGAFQGFGTTIFTVMSAMALEHDAINLGQGFPDEDGPETVRAEAARIVLEGPNQYPPMMGLPQLRRAVADHNRRFYGLSVDPMSQVMVTSGATEALTASILGLVDPGDEVVMVEPLYDSYLPMVLRAGGVPRFVPLNPPEWRLEEAPLLAAVGSKTKLIILNSPMNPTGKVFEQEELSLIADVAQKADALVLCDEVYEHLAFDRPHRPLMTFPGMADRCLRVGSAGKTFSLTGWKVGYLTGAPDLIAAVAKAHQFLTFTTPPALQLATALGLGLPDAYFRDFTADMAAKRDLLRSGLAAAGFDVLPSQGTYFLTVDIRSVGWAGDDAAFCKDITRNARVAAVPVSAFYADQGRAPKYFARFCFCKRPEVLMEATERLQAYFRAA